jgi:hypothetical protein
LDRGLKHFVQDARPPLHDPDLEGSRILVLTVFDGVDKSIGELLSVTKEVRLDKLHHAVIYKKMKRDA